jgi:hypothetical protein
VLVSQESEAVQQLAQRLLSSDLPSSSVFLAADLALLGGSCLTPPEGPVLPFLTTEDILCALHILRC